MKLTTLGSSENKLGKIVHHHRSQLSDQLLKVQQPRVHSHSWCITTEISQHSILRYTGCCGFRSFKIHDSPYTIDRGVCIYLQQLFNLPPLIYLEAHLLVNHTSVNHVMGKTPFWLDATLLIESAKSIPAMTKRKMMKLSSSLTIAKHSLKSLFAYQTATNKTTWLGS